MKKFKIFNSKKFYIFRNSKFEIPYFSKRGFTLIEMIATVAVLGIIVALSVSSFVNFNTREALEQETGKVLALLAEARTLTLSAKDGAQYGVHFEAQKTVLFSGSVYNAGSSANRAQVFNTEVTASAITLAGGGAEVIFKKLTGATTQSGTVTLASARKTTDTKTVTIVGTGIAYSN